MANKRRVLLIGWDAADWKVIQPLVDGGHMPNLRRLIERGIMGNLATIQPMLSPMVWTSIATGKRPFKHGVLGFSEVVPETGAVRPVSSFSRKTKAVWNILNQEGKTCHVVGWWPSHPVEPLRGSMVSNHFQTPTAPLGKPWPLPPGAVHPQDVAESLAGLRIHPNELEGDMLRDFVPRAPEIDQATDKRLLSLAKIVAESASIHAAATKILSTRRDWDFAAVYYDAIDHFSHGFMRYHPPRLNWVSQSDFDMYSSVLGGGYVFHDSMLGVLLALAGEDTTVILISDHGFHPDALRPESLPNEPAGPAAEHRPFGIFVAAGPGLREDELLYSASVLDIAPTVLSLFDLPIGRDMDGRALTAIYNEAPPARYIDSWDMVEGDAAMLTGSEAGSSEAAAAVIKQLADLGYIDAPGADRQHAMDQTVREERYNLARALADGGRDDEAADMFAELWENWPDESRFGVHLLQIQTEARKVIEARATMELLRVRKRATAEKSIVELREFIEQIRKEQQAAAVEEAGKKAAGGGDGAGGQASPADAPATEAGPAASPGEAEGLDQSGAAGAGPGIDMAKLSDQQRHKLRQFRAKAGTNPHAFAFLEGSLLAAEGRWREALDALERVAGVQASQMPALHLKRAEVRMALKDTAEAMNEYSRALELDPVNPAARFGLARAALARKDYPRAAAEARAAIGCRYQFPQAHLVAGIAYWRQELHVEAEASLRAAVALNPVFPAGHRVLAMFLEKVKRDPRGWEHRRLAAESRRRIREWKAGIRPEGQHPAEYRASFGESAQTERPQPATLPPARECVVIVSGLPRSGTSMMMQMIQAGGFPVLTDDARAADENNPKGYLEFAASKHIATDKTWVAGAVGKAVKLVSPLLPHLPKGPPYRIVNMRRPAGEIVASQRAMLNRTGKEGGKVSDEALTAIYERQIVSSRTFLAYMERNGSAAVLDVSYHEALEDSGKVAERLRAFLGDTFDAGAAAGAVDQSLYRSRKPGKSSAGKPPLTNDPVK
ncbi:MAG: alkaline phosphatase family protein [bacterium]